MKILPRQIHLDAPCLGTLEKEYLSRCIDSTYVSTYGTFVPEFEDRFAAFLRCSKAVSLQSGTAGLHMALYELGIGPGDEVIVPALTFVATANAVKYVGATPVFSDVDPLTWTMDPLDVERRISERTKALMPVHLYGNPCMMEKIVQSAQRHGLYVIEDATESLGSSYRGRFTGTLGDFGVFSFNGNKLITTGGGGMIIGPDEKRLDHIKFLVNQARDESRGYYHPEIGFNYRMTNIEAALGLAQMERIGDFIKKKKLFYDIYNEVFQGVELLRLQSPQSDCEVIWWLNSVVIDTDAVGHSIPEIQRMLKNRGIPSRRTFMPVNEFPPYRNGNEKPCPVARRIFENSLSLPSSSVNDQGQIRYAAEQLTALLSKPLRRQKPSILQNTRREGVSLSTYLEG